MGARISTRTTAAVNRFGRGAGRRRTLATAALAATVLAMGGLTACSEEEKPESASTSGGAGDATEDNTGDTEEPTQENTEESAEESSGENAAESGGEDSGGTEEGGEEQAGANDSGVFAAGEVAAYDNGLEVTVSAAEPYTPSEYAIGHTEGNEPYGFTVSVENTGDEAIDVTFLLATARAGEEGAEAEEIFDDVVGGGFNGEVLPGRSATAQYAFDAPADAGFLEVHIEQALEWDTSAAIWELPL